MALKKNLGELTDEELDARIAELQGKGAEENAPAPEPSPEPADVGRLSDEELDARIAQLQAQGGAEEGEVVEPAKPSEPQRRQPEVVRRDAQGLSDEEHWRKGDLSTGEYVSLKTKMEGLEPFEVTDETGNAEGMAKTVGNLAVNALTRPFANFRQMRQQQLMRGFEDDGEGGQRPVAEMSDAEQDFLADEAGMNGWRGAARHLLGNLFANRNAKAQGSPDGTTVGQRAVRWLFSSDDEDTPLKAWDRTEGVKYQDDAERRAARAKYLQDLAGGMVEMGEVEKENARREFKGRNPTEDVDMLGELVVQGAYTLPFAVDRTGLLAGAISAASRYGELKSDKYAFDKDGNMVVAERRDTNDLGAATKATLGAAAEVGVEKVGGELATGAASRLLKATIGRIPLVSETAKGLAATEAGRAVSQFLRRYRVLASRTGFNSLPAEIVEEFEQDLIDRGLGIGERESAKEGTGIASRTAEATAEFWDPKDLWNLTKSMVGLMVVQGGAAHAADRLGSRRIDAVLEKGLGLDESTVRSYTKGEKQVAFEAWLNGMDEKEVAATFRDGAKYINRLVKEIGDTAGRSDFGTASEVKFTVPTNGDGNALWNRATDEYGRPCLRIADEKAGVTVDEYELHDGSTVYRVYDKAGNRMSADSKDAALAAADRLATKSALRDAKIAFIEGMKGRMFDGANVFYGDTVKDVMQGIREEYGEDALKSLTDSKEFRQGAATGQAFHFQNDAGEDCVAFVLDNIRDADDAMTAVNHEVLGHTGIGAAVEDKGAFLEKMDAAGLDPADRRNFEDEVAQQMRERGLASREDVFKDPQAAEELFAYVAENIRRGGNASLKNKFVAAVRAVVREKFGRDLKFNGDDIYAMIDRGRAKIEQGKGGKSVTGKAGVQQDADTDFALVRSDDQRAAQDEEAARQQREAEAERLQHEANALRVMDEDQARDAALEKMGGPQEVADYRLYYQQERLHADLVADSFPELFADFCETRHMRVDDPQSRVFFYRAVLEGQKMRQTDSVTIEQTMRGETGEATKPAPEPAKPTPTPAPQPERKPAKPAKGGEKGPSVGGSVDKLRPILEKTEIGRAILTNYETAVADDPAFAEAQFQRSVKANAEDLGLETHENGPVSAPDAGDITSRPEGAASGKGPSDPQSGDSGEANGAEGLEVTELKPITAKSASHNFDRVKRNLIRALRGLATTRGKDGAAKAEAAFRKALADFTAAPSSLWRFRVRDTATGDVFKFDLDARIDRKTQTLNREQVAGLVSRAAPGVNFKVAKKVADRLCDELDPLVPEHVAASYAAKVNNPKGYEKNFTRAVDAYVEANPDSLLASFVGRFGNRVTPKMLAQVFAQDATVDADLLAEQDVETWKKTWDTELENWAAESGRFGPRREDGSYDFSGVYERLVKELAEANADTRTVEDRKADAERGEAERAEFEERRERAAEEEAYDFEGEAEVRQAYDDLLAEATVRDQRDNPVGSLADIPDGEMFSLGEDEYEMVEHLDGGAVVVEEFRDFDDIRRYVVTPREGGVDVKEVTDGIGNGEAGGAGVRGGQDREGDRRQSDADVEGRRGVPRRRADRAAEESGATGRATGGAASRAADPVGGAQAEGGTLTLASASAEEIAAEEARNRRRRIIGMRQAAPLKGGGTPWQETELGSQGAGGQMELQFRRVAEKHGVIERAVRRAGPGILALDALADANEAEAEEAANVQFHRAAANNADAKSGNAFKPSWRISRLYTGSAADYEKPSLLKVGTGEGSQVYGWGLYASDQRGIADNYAEIAGNARGGIALDHIKNPAERMYAATVLYHGGDRKKALDDLASRREDVLKRLGHVPADSLLDEAVDFARKNVLSSEKYEYKPASRIIYEQTFFTNRAPGDESHLLKWYEPVSEENLNRILDQGEKEKGDDFLFMLDEQRTNGENASDIYNGLVRIFGSPQAASEFLARADIDGIKYPVDSYGGKTVKDGDEVGWNYVSFRDDNITVDHKWVDGELQFRQPRSRVTPAEDAAYMDAVNRGDMEMAQRMVREAAAKAMPNVLKGEDGLPLEVYRGGLASGANKYVFPRRPQYRASWIEGTFLTDNKQIAKAFSRGGTVLSLFAEIKKPLVIDAKGNGYVSIPVPGDSPKWLKEKYSLDNELDADSITKNAFDHGYDGVVIKNVVEGVGGPSATDIIVRDPSQIKSADPVTRNDAGEIIPLSQRFSKSPDIRFRQPRFRDNPEARALSDALGLSPSELAALGFSATRNFDEGREERADRAARTRNAAELDLVRNHGRILSPGGMRAAMTSLREWTQDYLIRLRNLEEQLGVGRDLSAYYAADRAYGLVTDKAARFQKEMVEPLMRELEAAGVTNPEGFADFGQYLVARHGREYNEMIAQRSPLVAQALEDRRTKALAQGIISGVADLDDANIANFQTLLGWSDAETERFRRDVSGSSKSTAYWARLLDQYRADGRAAKYAAAERIVRDMTKAVREELVATGRLSRAQADAWERLSPNYVPMMHDEEEDIDLWSRFFWSAEGAGGSRRGGNSYREAEVHHAFGRTTMPDNPVPFVVQMYQSAIQRGADNLARKALADIVRAQEAKLATDPDAPQIGRVFRYMGEEERKEAQKKVGSLEAAVATGTATPAQRAELARLRTALAESANAGAAIPFTEVVGANGMTYRVPKVSSVEAENPDIVAFKEDGELKFVKLGVADSQKQVEKGWLASSDAAAIGAALKKQTLVHHWLIDGLRRVTAAFSALRTAWSPTFLVSNWTADNAQAARNLYATFGAAGAAKFEHFVFARNSFGAARAVLNDNYGTSLIQRYAKEWAENGGRIGGMATENFADIQKKFDRQLRAMTSQFRHLAGIRSMADAMTYVGDRMNGLKEFSEHWNSVVEMSTRIAAYATYREMTKGNGKSDAENIADAVSYSRDITVNFNRKGRLTPLLNAWWAFSNASIQDLQRSFQAFGERRYGAAVGGVAGLAARTGLKMGAGLFILGFLSSMLGFGQDDPEEEKEGKAQWKDTKEYVKQNKMAFRIGDRTFSIPVRGLSRLPYYLGHVAYEMFTGRRSAAKAASDVVGLVGDNLTDVMGSTDSWTQWFLPSVIRPVSEIVRNRTFTGSTMYRESRTAYDVKSNMGRTNTAPAWHTVAKLLNRLGGGENRGAFGGKSDRGSDLPLVGRAFDQQPEKLEAVWNWLGGSAMKDLGQIAGTVKDVFGFMAGQGWNRKVRNVPFASRVMANLDENSARFHEAENAYRKARAEAESFDPDATEEIARFVQDHPWAARENRRWGQELKDLSNMASNLMSQEMKAGSDEEREAIHKMRLGVQYLFLHRLETDPRTDGPEELRFERERSREADRALKAAKREQKRAQKREQRGRGRMLLK